VWVEKLRLSILSVVARAGPIRAAGGIAPPSAGGNTVSLAADLQIVGPYTTAQLAPSRNPCFGHDMSIKAIFIDMFSRHVVAIDISA
jgi:hypothetical protein